jgi:serine/threonine protein kinase
VKLCDFGTARFDTEDNLKTLAKMTGTYAYLAPEAFYGQKFTDKTDVWAIGIILWELANRVVTGKYQLPYAEHKLKRELQILYQVAEKNLRPTMPQCVPELLKTIDRCLAKEPSERPSAAALHQEMEALLKNCTEDPERWNTTVVVF